MKKLNFLTLTQKQQEQVLLKLSQKGSYIQYIDNPSEELQKLAVSRNGYAIEYINNPSEEVIKLSQLSFVEKILLIK